MEGLGRKKKKSSGKARKIMRSIVKKCLTFTYFFLWSMGLFSIYAHAYVDPSALTYLVQIIAGAVIGCGAIAGVYWTKFKKKIKGKTKETDIREPVDVDDINDEF